MCLDDQILNTYLDGELAEPWKTQIEEHIKHCRSCEIRSENIRYLRKTIKNACIDDEEIKVRQDRVLAVLEKNHLNRKKADSPWHKQVRFKVSQVVGIAAAFVVVLVGSLSVANSTNEKVIPFPEHVTPIVDIANITPARTVETKTLDSYSLDDILKNLDARGYDVDVRLKGIQPVVEENAEETVKEQAESTSGN